MLELSRLWESYPHDRLKAARKRDKNIAHTRSFLDKVALIHIQILRLVASIPLVTLKNLRWNASFDHNGIDHYLCL